MKFVRSVSFDKKSLDLIDEFMQKSQEKNFSYAVCTLIQREEKFRKIALKLQNKI